MRPFISETNLYHLTSSPHYWNLLFQRVAKDFPDTIPDYDGRLENFRNVAIAVGVDGSLINESYKNAWNREVFRRLFTAETISEKFKQHVISIIKEITVGGPDKINSRIDELMKRETDIVVITEERLFDEDLRKQKCLSINGVVDIRDESKRLAGIRVASHKEVEKMRERATEIKAEFHVIESNDTFRSTVAYMFGDPFGNLALGTYFTCDNLAYHVAGAWMTGRVRNSENKFRRFCEARRMMMRLGYFVPMRKSQADFFIGKFCQVTGRMWHPINYATFSEGNDGKFVIKYPDTPNFLDKCVNDGDAEVSNAIEYVKKNPPSFTITLPGDSSIELTIYVVQFSMKERALRLFTIIPPGVHIDAESWKTIWSLAYEAINKVDKDASALRKTLQDLYDAGLAYLAVRECTYAINYATFSEGNDGKFVIKYPDTPKFLDKIDQEVDDAKKQIEEKNPPCFTITLPGDSSIELTIYVVQFSRKERALRLFTIIPPGVHIDAESWKTIWSLAYEAINKVDKDASALRKTLQDQYDAGLAYLAVRECTYAINYITPSEGNDGKFVIKYPDTPNFLDKTKNNGDNEVSNAIEHLSKNPPCFTITLPGDSSIELTIYVVEFSMKERALRLFTIIPPGVTTDAESWKTIWSLAYEAINKVDKDASALRKTLQDLYDAGLAYLAARECTYAINYATFSKGTGKFVIKYPDTPKFLDKTKNNGNNEVSQAIAHLKKNPPCFTITLPGDSSIKLTIYAAQFSREESALRLFTIIPPGVTTDAELWKTMWSLAGGAMKKDDKDWNEVKSKFQKLCRPRR
jgi:hypothetical protein